MATRSQTMDNIMAKFQAQFGVPETSEFELMDSLPYLTLAELQAVDKAIDDNDGEHMSSIGHDIHGIARMHYGPKFHRDTFLPRMVKLPRRKKGEVAK